MSILCALELDVKALTPGIAAKLEAIAGRHVDAPMGSPFSNFSLGRKLVD